MYSNKFVVILLVNGQVQQEFANGEVHIPFGSEYSIRFRNKNDRRAVAKLFIDGERMCRGGFIIPAHSYRDIDCSSQTNRKFKFVDLQSTEAQDYGKDQTNADKKMGLIRVEWHLEKVQEKKTYEVHHHHHYQHGRQNRGPWMPAPWETTLGASAPSFQCDAAPAAESMQLNAAPTEGTAGGSSVRRAFAPAVKDGATVEGGVSNMRFGELNMEYEETATVLQLYLRGYHPRVIELPIENRHVEEIVEDAVTLPAPEPVPVPMLKPYPSGGRFCDKCGTAVKESSNFCHACGNKLK